MGLFGAIADVAATTSEESEPLAGQVEDSPHGGATASPAGRSTTPGTSPIRTLLDSKNIGFAQMRGSAIEDIATEQRLTSGTGRANTARVPFLRIPGASSNIMADNETLDTYEGSVGDRLRPVQVIRTSTKRHNLISARVRHRSTIGPGHEQDRPSTAAAMGGQSHRIVGKAEALAAEANNFQQKLSPRLRGVIRGHKSALRPRAATVQAWEVQDELAGTCRDNSFFHVPTTPGAVRMTIQSARGTRAGGSLAPKPPAYPRPLTGRPMATKTHMPI